MLEMREGRPLFRPLREPIQAPQIHREVIVMHSKQGMRTGVGLAAAAAGSFLFIAAASSGVRSSLPASFDLAVRDLTVKQLSSTPMFRTIEVTCVVENRGPKPSNATAWVLITRSGDPSPLVLKVVSIPKAMDSGDQFQVRAQAFAWVPAAISYRCDIEFGAASAAGDANPSNDAAEVIFPKF